MLEWNAFLGINAKLGEFSNVIGLASRENIAAVLINLGLYGKIVVYLFCLNAMKSNNIKSTITERAAVIN